MSRSAIPRSLKRGWICLQANNFTSTVVSDQCAITGDWIDAMLLLGGTSNGRYYGLKKSHKGPLTQDELTRISLLIGIFRALNMLFSEKLANQWVSRPNSNPMFKNQPPLVFLIQGGMPGMLAVRRLLDSRRGGR